MDEIYNKHMPIGTVVKLKKSDALFMIIGYNAKYEEDKKNDYIAYLYPMGFTNKEDNFLFDYEDIDKVVFKGYNDINYNNLIKAIGGD